MRPGAPRSRLATYLPSIEHVAYFYVHAIATIASMTLSGGKQNSGLFRRFQPQRTIPRCESPALSRETSSLEDFFCRARAHDASNFRITWQHTR